MVWYVISIIFFAVATALLVYTRMRDAKYEKLKTSEAMGEDLKLEIEEEREAALDRQKKFNEALKEAEKKG